MDPIPLALTYDDVLLVPRFSSVRSRNDVNCETRFAGHITLKAPFVSANMDTVTEARMAIAMAEFGGIGVIHRFLPIAAQVAEVVMVKRHRSPIVEDRSSVSHRAAIAGIRSLLAQLGINHPAVAGEPVLVSEHVTPGGRLALAHRGTSPGQARQLERPSLVDDNNRLAGLLASRDLARRGDGSPATRDDRGRLRVAAAVGVVDDFLERGQALVEAGADALVIDIAHGDSALMLATIRQLRRRLGTTPLVAGNVATAEATERLIEEGVDAIKVGVGPGSVCITRQVAGVGVPQFTAVVESAKVAPKYGVPIIADGGIRYSGDVAKAMGAGASTVMLGNLLAGTDESPGVVVVYNGQKMKVARGMASREAAEGRALRDGLTLGRTTRKQARTNAAPEGVQAMVPCRGTASEVLLQLLAGLCSGMSYCDASTVEEMWRNARFVRQTAAGRRESASHDVVTL